MTRPNSGQRMWRHRQLRRGLRGCGVQAAVTQTEEISWFQRRPNTSNQRDHSSHGMRRDGMALRPTPSITQSSGHCIYRATRQTHHMGMLSFPHGHYNPSGSAWWVPRAFVGWVPDGAMRYSVYANDGCESVAAKRFRASETR